MNDIEAAKNFINAYVEKSTPKYEQILEQLNQKAAEVNPLAYDVAQYFKKIALLGKRLRGSLTLLGFQLSGGSDTKAIITASVLPELIHAGLLVQDDVMDHARSRRGLRSLHEEFSDYAIERKVPIDANLFGNGCAMCVADCAFFHAWGKLHTLPFQSDKIKEASILFADVYTKLGFGQIVDLANLCNSQNEIEILKLLWLKSGLYTTQMPMQFGYILGPKRSKDTEKTLITYAECLGWAFQIQDDLLSTFGKTEETGKPNDSDIKEGKNTLLILHLKKHGSDKQQRILNEVLGNSQASESDVQNLRDIMIAAGSYDAVYSKGQQYVEKGLGIVPKITSDENLRAILRGYLKYMMARVK